MQLWPTLLLSIPFLPAGLSNFISPRQVSVDAWVSAEEPIARSSIFRNIGNQGEFAKSAAPGVVIASPSTSSPDYYYQWTRDAALVYKTLLNTYINGNTSMETLLEQYIDHQAGLQRLETRSGGYTSGGLGEPKFYVDGSAFNENWGRPQPDGPALRTIVLAKYANILLDAGRADYVQSRLYDGKLPTESVIKADLEYVSHNWEITNGFDLWEEITGLHFFTMMVQHRALIEGAELADRLNDPGAAEYYRRQAAAIKARLPQFWDAQKGYLVGTLRSSQARSGEDCGTLLGSIHGNGKRGMGIYTPGSDEVLATLQALVDSMKDLYPLNQNPEAPGIAVGRYPSDVYDGVGTSIANPWFICTFTTSEILYSALVEFNDRGNLTVSSISERFFKQFSSSVSAGSTYGPGTSQWTDILGGMKTYADSFIAVAQRHAAVNGSMSEQFGRIDGFMKGARDLTWSYASFLSMRWARNGEVAF
ncbi:putative glucoamylase [Ascodesmis nigricans]|uniref:glucan 1,4-alpha-glucosidase n=1 Tax=Ascodesmis nigricans TaxID=341454 RepID=A0A4S2MYW7_9PEZI|nr:putative glucoamylase [Ascodesmis nigricans]